MRAIIYPVMAVMLFFWAVAGPTAAWAQHLMPTRVEPEYEELAAAAQLAQSSAALNAASEAGATLTQKRLALSDKPIVQALDLMRRWLDTPVLTPRAPDADEPGITSILPGVRSLGRAISVRNYVLLADGRVSDAIDSVRDGMRLSYAIGHHTMIAWLSGIIIQTTLTKSLTTHLDQLSARDCDHVLRLAREWSSSYDPLPMAVESARQAKLSLLRKAGKQDGIAKLIQEMFETGDGVSIAARMEELSPQVIQQTMERAAIAIDAAYQKVRLELSTPYWERAQLAARLLKTLQTDDPLAQQIVNMAMPDYSRTLERYTQVQTTARLLGCHAAIRRYRWEQDRLPPSLKELKLGDMAIDPFTGKPFLYKPAATTYTLESAGPNGHGLPE